MLQRKVLISEFRSAIDTRAARSVAVQKVPALEHEVLDHSVEFAVLVALRPARGTIRLARAELSEILCCARYDICEELELDAAKRLAAQSDVEEDDWIGLLFGHGECEYCPLNVRFWRWVVVQSVGK